MQDCDIHDLQQLIKTGGPQGFLQWRKRFYNEQNKETNNLDQDDSSKPKLRKWNHPDFQMTNQQFKFHGEENPRKAPMDYFADVLASQTLTAFSCQAPGCPDHFESIKEFDEHYFVKHRYVCCECKKCFPSAHLLGLHVQEWHDSFFKVKSMKQPMFECYEPTCLLKFNSPANRFKHCVDDHKFPKDYRYSTCGRDVYPKQKQPKKLKSPQSTEKMSPSTMEVEAEVVRNTEEAMDTLGQEPKVSKKSESEVTADSSKKKPAVIKPSTHFTFGHSASTRFVPRYEFAMGKGKARSEKKPPSSTPSDTDNNEQTMDFSEVQNALFENVQSTATSEGDQT